MSRSTTRRARARVGRWMGLLALLVTAASSPAQERPAVGLRCEVPAPSLTRLWGSEAAQAVADALCVRLRERLTRHPVLGFWKYLYPVVAEHPAVTLTFSVLDGNAEDTFVRLQYTSREALPPPPWDEEWRPPGAGSLGRDPSPDEAPALFERVMARRLLDRHRVELETQLKRLPLGEARRLILGDEARPRVLSTLPWEELKQLRSSTFRVSCAWPRKRSTAYLLSVGHPVPGWLDPVDAPAYEAFLVVARERELDGVRADVEDVADEIGELQPRWLYLTQYQDPDVEVYLP